jgi:hypothetical protein
MPIWFRTANAAVTIIKVLLALAATSGGAMTLALLRDLPWYEAVTYGCVLTAALVVIITGVDNLWRTHTIDKKVAMWQLRCALIEVDPITKKFSLHLVAHIRNNSIRPIFFVAERVNCHIDKLTHDRSTELDKPPLEVQSQNSLVLSVPVIPEIDPSKQRHSGELELGVRYGKNENNVKKIYKTRGLFIIYIYMSPTGMPMAHVETTSGKGSYE